MGAATVSTLISEGLQLAGQTDLSTRALVWLNQWLRSQYAAWPWPFLQKRVSGVTLSSGALTLNVGGSGGSGTTDIIHKVYDPIYLYNSARNIRGVARITSLIAGALDQDEHARPSTQTGQPTRVKVRQSSTALGQFALIPDPIPERDYLIAFDYSFIPADQSTSDFPIYPNDRTMVQAVRHMALEYMADERAKGELEILIAMVQDDRVKYGQIPGTNSLWDIDTDVYR